ncbi:HEPN domain-containing protein [Desulfosporosinus sp. SB140]|uniref:HEPN domain-containing protein n=1 Tax=Desulfosporosinus paludis TaxID=3115649 RepID=UPI00388FD0B3
MSLAMKAFWSNRADIFRLLQIHSDVGGIKQGRRFGLEVLNKSAVVLITACWEAFVEDLAIEAFDHMLGHCQQYSQFPDGVRRIAGKTLRSSLDERKIWELAGDGWKQASLFLMRIVKGAR